MSKREKRIAGCELRVSTAGNGERTVTGVIPYNSYSCDLGGFTEVIAPGAFESALAPGADILCLRDHKSSLLLGRTKSGTLQFSDSPDGLHFTNRMPATSQAADLATSIERGDIDGNSFGFVCEKDSWTRDAARGVVRTLEKVSLFEVSICSSPAYAGSSVSLRSCPQEIRSAIGAEVERRYDRIVSAVTSTAWAILPEKLQAICAILSARSSGEKASSEEIKAAMMAPSNPEEDNEEESTGTVAVIPVLGVISQRMNMFTEFSGGTSTQQLAAQFRAALNDGSVSAIVFDIDSPGGSVNGVPELAAEVLAARGSKPIIAISNGEAASAAYWIASAADSIVVTPSGQVGSIGVYCVHEDDSQYLKDVGVKITLVSAGKYKTEGNPYEPLSDDAEAAMQSNVDDYYSMFVQAVAAGRGVKPSAVTSGFGQGRMVMAKQAVSIGLADRIATLDEILAELKAPSDSEGSRSMTKPNAGAKSRMTDCTCDCPECDAGVCEDCSDVGCTCDGCTCEDAMSAERLRLDSMLALAERKHR